MHCPLPRLGQTLLAHIGARDQVLLDPRPDEVYDAGEAFSHHAAGCWDWIRSVVAPLGSQVVEKLG